MRLLVFNPDHDLALAAATPHYTAPPNAVVFANDFATLPAWLHDEGEVVSALPMVDAYQRLGGVCSVAPRLQRYDSVEPWGWNAAIRQRLLHRGLDAALLPSDELLDHWRLLSHRRTAMQLAEFLQEPIKAEELTTMEAMEGFVMRYPETVLKAPWSGSGRGLMWGAGTATPQIKSRCQKLLATQGCVMGERRLRVVQDFAMEFWRNDEGKTSFRGYSVFNTRNGVYTQSLLGTTKTLEEQLTRYVPKHRLEALQQACCIFISERLTDYVGNVGIDMFVYANEAGCFEVNPAVEVNLRNTMGNVALELSTRWLSPDAIGTFTIDFSPTPGALLADHLQRATEKPLTLHEGKIVKGYLSLCPVTEQTHFRARLEVGF